MCDNAWQWAKAHNKWRRNPIHKEEECKLVIDDEFKWNDHHEHGTEQSGQFQMEVGVVMGLEGCYFNGCGEPFHSVPNLPLLWDCASTRCEDPDGTLLEDDPVPEGLAGLVPDVDAGKQEETQCVPQEAMGPSSSLLKIDCHLSYWL